jgi:predicted Rossmann-fold nucleotide-binding protein
MELINTVVTPEPESNILSQEEIRRIRSTTKGGIKELFKKCALAVMNSLESGLDVLEISDAMADFDIEVLQLDRGIKLEITNAPAYAFVDGNMIKGVKEHLFAVLRDIVYYDQERRINPDFSFSVGAGTTNAIFNILRNARVMQPGIEPNKVVCWGGHSISKEEYQYTVAVGYHLGLRELDIITGCGPGAMHGPMKGALVGQSKQRLYNGRFIGITEPGIIAAESPNPIVNKLVIMPDIEKRLESFVRLGHSYVIFPGGVGTMEELMFILGVLLDEQNKDIPLRVILTGNKESERYLEQVDTFIRSTLGIEAANHYQIIIGDPIKVAKEVQKGIHEVTHYRKLMDDAFHFNWRLHIDPRLQSPFDVCHDTMAQLLLTKDQDKHALAANLRNLFSGIVTGNVKEKGILAVQEKGPYLVNGDTDLCLAINDLLESFIRQNRMKLSGLDYQPSYQFVNLAC